MKRVLVAGATGYLGGFVARELKARGYFVRALARSPEKLDHLRESLDEISEAEITRPFTCQRPTAGHRNHQRDHHVEPTGSDAHGEPPHEER